MSHHPIVKYFLNWISFKLNPKYNLEFSNKFPEEFTILTVQSNYNLHQCFEIRSNSLFKFQKM